MSHLGFPKLYFPMSLVAWLWKTFVLLSPLLAYKTHNLWLHICASLSKRILISSFNSQTWWLQFFVPVSQLEKGDFFFFSSSLHTLPKHFRFHQSKSFPHCSSFARIVLPKIPPSLDFQDASIVSPHLKLDSYISSKRKIFFFVGGTKPRGLIKRGEWFEVSQQKWWTWVLGNFMKKEFVAKPLSNLSQIDRPS